MDEALDGYDMRIHVDNLTRELAQAKAAISIQNETIAKEIEIGNKYFNRSIEQSVMIGVLNDLLEQSRWHVLSEDVSLVAQIDTVLAEISASNY